MPKVTPRLPPVPSTVTGDLGTWLRLVAQQLNSEAYVSKFSGTNPNTSAVTGIPGNLVVNIRSASDNSRLWVMGGSGPSTSTTTGWKQLGLGGGTTTSGSSWTLVLKPSDQTKASDNSLLPDSALSVPLVAGSWIVRGKVWLNTGNATMDYKLDLDVPGGLSGAVTWMSYVTAGVATGAGQRFEQNLNSLPTATSVVGATSGLAHIEFNVLVAMSSSGTFQFLWAQDTSDAGVITVYKGSYLEYVQQD